jgi:membrane-anchored protein YejM (alkaline phosphatase superfamily)
VESLVRVALVLTLNIPVLALLLTSNLGGVEPDLLVSLYVSAIILGYYVLSLLIAAAALTIVPMFTPRISLALSCLLLTLVVCYLFLDSRVYAVCRFHLDPFWVSYIWHDFTGIGLPVASLVHAGAVLVGLTILEITLFRCSRSYLRHRWVLPALTAISLLALISSQLIHIVAFEKDVGRITSLTPRFPLYSPATSHRNATRYGDLLPIASLPGSRTDTHSPGSAMRYPLADCAATLPEGARPLNVVFLVLESWRHDAMSDSVTPYIHALAGKSSIFRNHFSSGNATTPGVFGLLYGLHPTYWMAVKSNNAALHNPLLIDLMEEADYSFGIYADSHFKRHKIKGSMFRGIDVHEDFAGTSRPEMEADMNTRMISFLRERRDQDRPFMLFAFYKASHFPYTYPDSFRIFAPVAEINPASAVRRDQRARYLNDYYNAVHFDDALIGELLRELESLELMERTVIVVTTDHGEQFDDDGAGYWGHSSNFTQYQIRVPLVVYHPGRSPRVVDTVTSHVDIPTTLIQEVFGVQEEASSYSNGRNLFRSLSEDRVLVVGSNVNHAFIIGEDVYAVLPLHVRGYRLDDIGQLAGELRVDLLPATAEAMGRFFLPGAQDCAASEFDGRGKAIRAGFAGGSGR